jgi:hypothetical protein
MVLSRKAADEISITISFKSFGVKKTNGIVVTCNKLTNNFAGLLTSGLGLDMARRPPDGSPCITLLGFKTNSVLDIKIFQNIWKRRYRLDLLLRPALCVFTS